MFFSSSNKITSPPHQSPHHEFSSWQTKKTKWKFLPSFNTFPSWFFLQFYWHFQKPPHQQRFFWFSETQCQIFPPPFEKKTILTSFAWHRLKFPPVSEIFLLPPPSQIETIIRKFSWWKSSFFECDTISLSLKILYFFTYFSFWTGPTKLAMKTKQTKNKNSINNFSILIQITISNQAK